MNKQNRGFIDEPNDDFVFGSDRSLGSRFKNREILQPDSDWVKYLPVTEPQSTTIMDTYSCVSFGTLNAIEMIRKRVSDVDENLSDRFVAKGSGTIPNQGNSPSKVADFIRKYWSVYESEYPFTSKIEEFFAEIPKHLFSLASARGAEYDFGYEIVQHKDIREALKYSPLGISVPAWYPDETGRFYRPKGVRDGHWTIAFGIRENGDLLVFDTYYPFIKTLRADVVPSVIYGYYLKKNIANQSLWNTFLELIKKLFSETPEATEVVREPKLIEKVLMSAQEWMGKDARPLKLAPQDLGCAESLCTVVNSVDSEFPKDITYTPFLKKYLDSSPRYKQTLIYKPGCIIISPTIPEKFVGHVGIFESEDKIYSNNSKTGLWDDHFTLASWISRYRREGGLSIYFYEPVMHTS